MLTKSNCETIIRSLAHDWRGEPEQLLEPTSALRFEDFVTWLRVAGYGMYLDHLSKIGHWETARGWFREELHIREAA